VQGAAVPDVDLARQREVVNAFLAAARAGDFNALLAVLDPDVVLRADRGAVPPGASRVVRGAKAVAEGAVTASPLAQFARPVLVNGAAGVVAFDPRGRLRSVTGFTVTGGRSSKSTSSPTPRASASSAWRSSTTDADDRR
jgi:RNA polymerase sigma-70 factor (ECF subfamily)